MNRARHSSNLIAPLLLLLALTAARVMAVPPLNDPVLGGPPPSVRLAVPPLYLGLAPLFTTWDGISMLSMTRLRGFLQGLVIIYVLWRVGLLAWRRRASAERVSHGRKILRELRTAAISIAGLLLFVMVGALWHRPMVSLAGVPPGQSVVDLHSHTNRSHDVRATLMRGYDADANRRWHARAGFDAVFLTDHNLVASATPYPPGHPTLCPGTEVSAWGAHIVLLGDTLQVADDYRKDLAGLFQLLSNSDSAYGAPSLASLPEYRRNHWSRLDRLVAAGLDGFEIVNASPAANELSRAERDSVVALARARNRFVAGVTDSHGWGATSMVWNLISVPPHAANLCSRILDQLRLGFPAVRVVERHRLRPDDRWPMWLTPIGVLWESWRGMNWHLTIAWLAWTLVWLAWRWRRTALAKATFTAQDS
jgi:hypothetical protein